MCCVHLNKAAGAYLSISLFFIIFSFQRLKLLSHFIGLYFFIFLKHLYFYTLFFSGSVRPTKLWSRSLIFISSFMTFEKIVFFMSWLSY